jgi:hypothetical protein
MCSAWSSSRAQLTSSPGCSADLKILSAERLVASHPAEPATALFRGRMRGPARSKQDLRLWSPCVRAGERPCMQPSEGDVMRDSKRQLVYAAAYGNVITRVGSPGGGDALMARRPGGAGRSGPAATPGKLGQPGARRFAVTRPRVDEQHGPARRISGPPAITGQLSAGWVIAVRDHGQAAVGVVAAVTRPRWGEAGGRSGGRLRRRERPAGAVRPRRAGPRLSR